MFFTDQLNNTIELQSFPKRIISLVPSQTELLWDLGLRDELVGITKFCTHPPQLSKIVTRVGGTKSINIKKIRALNPDLIIGNKEENDQEEIKALQNEFNVWMSDIYNLNDSLQMIEKVGELVNKKTEANLLTQKISQSFSTLIQTPKKVLYFIWHDPFMVAGNATFIGDVLNRCGYINCLTNTNSRYPDLDIDDIKYLKPEVIFLSSEPYPFKKQHIRQLEFELPNTKIMLVNGELFSWYGSRLLQSATYLNALSNELML